MPSCGWRPSEPVLLPPTQVGESIVNGLSNVQPEVGAEYDNRSALTNGLATNVATSCRLRAAKPPSAAEPSRRSAGPTSAGDNRWTPVADTTGLPSGASQDVFKRGCGSKTADLDKNMYAVMLMLDGNNGAASPGDQVVYLPILERLLGEGMRELIRRQLLGDEMRELIQSEFQAVLRAPGHEDGERSMPQTQRRNGRGDEIEEALMTTSAGTMDRDVQDHLVKLAVAESQSWGKEAPTELYASYPEPWRTLFQKVVECVPPFGLAQAPDQPARLKALLESWHWCAFVNAVILANCIVMVFAANYEIAHYSETETMWSFRFWFDLFFLFFFGFEFGLKFACYRKYYFFDLNWKGNMFDLVLLMANLQSVVLSLIASGNRKLQNFTWLRLLRLLRVLKAFRVLRLAVHFNTLRAILVSTMNSFSNLLSCLVMLGLVFFIFALLMVSRIAAYFEDQGERLDQEQYSELMNHFGSVAIAMESLLLVSLNGADWGPDYFLVATMSKVDRCIYLLFIVFVHVALLNIIVGIFVEDAMKNLLPDDLQRAHELALDDQRLEMQLRDLCAEADTDGNGTLSPEEWDKNMKDGRMRELLQLLGFPVHHVHQFFHMIRTTNHALTDVVDCDEFVKGCMRMRGPSTTFDMNAVLFEVASLREFVSEQAGLLKDLRTKATFPHL